MANQPPRFISPLLRPRAIGVVAVRPAVQQVRQDNVSIPTETQQREAVKPVQETDKFPAPRQVPRPYLFRPPLPRPVAPSSSQSAVAAGPLGVNSKSSHSKPLEADENPSVSSPTTLIKQNVTTPSLGLQRSLSRVPANSGLSSRSNQSIPSPAIQSNNSHSIALDIDEGVEEHQFASVNESQVRYLPVSRVNPTGAVIPKAMASATHAALLKLARRVGDIDSWICDRLQWTPDQIGTYLTSEQIDAVALALDCSDRGEGLILADQTGFGKGRVLASISRAIALSGRPVVFLTEKANLFSDFWRDVRDIGSDDVFGRPFLMNDGARIVDTYSPDGRLLFPKLKKAEVDRVLRSGELPDGCLLMMTTYSQFNRKDTKKTKFLELVAADGHLILDESHNFVGDSTTSKTVGAALEVAKSSTFSSATFARGIENLSVYSTVFPWLRKIPGVDDMSAGQRRTIAEESVRLAAESGRIIRREHDLTNMVLNVKEEASTARLSRNEDLANRLAPILQSMAKLARSVFMTLEERNESNKLHIEALATAEERKAEKEVWSSANFGSRLSALMSQFLIALKVESCVEECVQSLLQGEKPVVVIESTMESLMRELQRDTDGPDDDEIAEAPIPQGELDFDSDASDTEDNSAVEAPRPPTFKEALALVTERLLRVSVRRGATWDKEEVFLDEPEFVKAQEKIAMMVADFPELSLSPIDDVRDKVEAAGQRLFAQGRIPAPWVADEISARSMRVVGGRYVSMPSVDRNQTVAKFNNGAIQMLVLTQAASTGLSIHDSDKFEDHGRRHMIELTMLRNVLARIQMWGRVWRRGQMTEPRFTTLSAGLPFESYELAAQNRKVEDLCASVTGSSKATVSMDVPDFINSVGNDTAHDFMQENQHIAESMCISLNVDKDEADREFYFVSKLLRRLPLLTNEQQRRVFSSFIASYNDRIHAGADPHHSGRDLEGAWKITARDVYEPGDGTSDPLFGRDVYLTTISSHREARPVSTYQVQQMIEAANARMPAQAPLKSWAEAILSKRDAILGVALPKRYRSVHAALTSSDDNSVKKTKQKIDLMIETLRSISPGSAIRVPGPDNDECVDGIVVDLRAPPIERANIGREYEIVFVVPGEEDTRSISLDGFVRRSVDLRLHDASMARRLMPSFDAAPQGLVPVVRKVLDGNGLAAVLAARRIGGGTKVTWFDEKQRARHGILLPKSAERRIASTPSRTHLPDVAAAVLKAGGRLNTNPSKPEEGLQLRPDGRGGARVIIPYSRKAAKPWETREIIDITGPFEGRGNEARVLPGDLMQLLRVVCGKGYEFDFEGRFRQLAIKTVQEVKAARISHQNSDDDVHLSTGMKM